MGRHSGRHGKAVAAAFLGGSRLLRAPLGQTPPFRVASNERGQATVEFALVTAGFIAATVALAAFWHAIADGLLADHAVAVASHHLQTAALPTITDIFLY